MKKVTVIIPTVGDRNYITDAIQSVNMQTYKNIELIVEKSKKTQGFNVNRGFEKSTGDYILILHDDDILPENSIELRVKHIEKYDFIHGNAIRFSDDFEEIYINPYKDVEITFENLCEKNMIHGGTTMYKREIFESVGMYDEKLIAAEEYDFHLKLLKNGYKCGYVNEILYKYRLHDNQKSIGKNFKKNKDNRKKIIENMIKKYR